jgi:hypothetical protein
MGSSPLTAVVEGATGLIGANKQKKAIERARREQAAAAAAAQERLAPYQEQGEYATQQIREGLDTGTLGGSFTPDEYLESPDYQFQLEQGQEALDRQQAARGNLYSGQALKEANRFSQGLASQGYQDAYNRWLQTQQNRYNQLSGQQNIGYGAAGGQNVIGLNEGNNMAQATMARRAAQDAGTAQAVGAGLNLINSGQQGLQQLATGGFGGFGSSLGGTTGSTGVVGY